MSERPFMPFYGSDFLSDTLHLDRALKFSYLMLIWHYWCHGGLPDDERQLANIAQMSLKSWRRDAPTLRAFFHDGWKHKRVDAELAKACDISEKRRDAAAQRRDRIPPNTSTNVDTRARRLLQPHPQEEKNSDAGASAPPSGAEPVPVYTDARHELWAEGTATLVALGVGEKQARSLIGRWLKDTRDDPERVLGAIVRARDGRVVDPIPWITRAIATKPMETGYAGRRQHQSPIREAAERLHAQINGRAMATASDGRGSRTPELRAHAGNGHARVLPQSRRP